MNGRIMTRREMLVSASLGFGGLAASSLLADDNSNSRQGRHHPAKAKNVIFLYMDGGVSHVDSFDPKQALAVDDGKNPLKLMDVKPTQFNNVGKVFKSPWGFKQHPKTGQPVSDLFPHIRESMEDICVINSMTSKFPEHTNANYFLHTGHGLQGRPSMGSWITYGLGSDNKNLPGFVVLNGGLIPPGGLDNFNNGFLSASYQGSVFQPTGTAVANIAKRESQPNLQQRKLETVAQFDSQLGAARDHDSINSAIANYELAFGMQRAVPELMDLSSEPKYLKSAYGFDHENGHTRTYARECMLARRMIERGVRFVELTMPNVHGGNTRWDAHVNFANNHKLNALAVDQPIAALIKDLKSRGLLDSTLVLWAGEFGRTPFAQGVDGRDHHPYAFSVWMAGGGIKGGTTYGQSDKYGYYVTQGKLEMHDLHATILHQLGIDHTRSTFRFSGRDMRLTDVHGRVVKDIIG